MKKTIIGLCYLIIRMLENDKSCKRKKKRRFTRSHNSPHKPHTHTNEYHRGCWAYVSGEWIYFKSQQSAATALANLFNLDIVKHDVYNAIRHRKGLLMWGDTYLCKVAYTKED